MVISAIVAVSANGVIGKGGKIPWRLPAEQAVFKRTTMGHPIIMGRKTHDSIGRALPGRANIVITRQTHYQAQGCTVVESIEQAIEVAKKSPGGEEIFIIGGGEIYNLAMPLTNRIYLTKVHTKLGGDKFFKYDPKEWREISTESHDADQDNKYGYDIITIQRN